MTDAPLPAPHPAPPPAPPPAAWHASLDAEILGTAQRKGWDLSDPLKAFATAANAYSSAEKLVGAPPDKILRMPEASADAAALDAFWQKLGAAKDPKEIDFSAIKGADGKPIDEKLAETLRATAVAARAPKDVVLSVAQALQKHFDNVAAEQKTITAGTVLAEQEALNKSWGANRETNLFIANQALEKLAAAAQIPLDKAKAAWDSLSKVGGLGASQAMNMLYEMGRRMGEDKFVSNGNNGNLPMTREAAMSEIQALKGDPVFGKRYTEGGVDERKRMDALHKIAYGQQSAA